MKNSQGFTLIEMVVVIVLIGIMAAGAGLLITRPIEAYNDQLRRQQLVDSAEMVLRKITTDIRGALPNSIRIDDSNVPNSWALEMVNTVDGARYRDEIQDGGGFTSTNHILQFSGTDSDFNVLGRFTTLNATSLPNAMRAVIYNTNPADIYNDAITTDTRGIISYPPGLTLTTSSAAGFDDEHHLTLPAAFQFDYQSPSQRVFVVDGPVSYICEAGRLMRFDGYAYQASQNTVDTVAELEVLAGVVTARVASQVSGCGISYQPGSSQRGGLITLDMTLTDSKNESVHLLHQVHVDNVP